MRSYASDPSRWRVKCGVPRRTAGTLRPWAGHGWATSRPSDDGSVTVKAPGPVQIGRPDGSMALSIALPKRLGNRHIKKSLCLFMLAVRLTQSALAGTWMADCDGNGHGPGRRHRTGRVGYPDLKCFDTINIKYWKLNPIILRNT